MNKLAPSTVSPESGQYRSLQILDELANNDALTQRDLSKRLGIALGLVNSYIKNLISKGYITVKNIPSKRYAYYLTPKGFAEKTRLAYDLLHDYTRIYREAKSGFQKLFRELELKGAKQVVFAGADEIAEIAYITLQETTLDLAGIIDDDRVGEQFFGKNISRLAEVANMHYDAVIITAYSKRDGIHHMLMQNGAPASALLMIFPLQAEKQ